MQTFTIDNDNNISVFATQEEAAAATATPFDSFASQQELADLAAGWPAERLLAVWNSLPGVTPVKKFTDRKTAISRIWARIEGLGEPVPGTSATTPEPKTTNPRRVKRKAKRGAQSAKGVAAPKNAPKAKKAAKAKDTAGRARAARPPGGGHAATQGGRHHFRAHEDHGLAASHRPGHGRFDEEGRVRGRGLQARRR